MQTAVEWLVDQMFKQGYFDGNKPLTFTNLDHLQQQAKEMEKQQIIDAWHKGYENQSPMIDEENCGQTYYTSTYGSKGSDATSSQTEISDEEIIKKALEYKYKLNQEFFCEGAKWYREQLKKKQ